MTLMSFLITAGIVILAFVVGLLVSPDPPPRPRKERPTETCSECSCLVYFGALQSVEVHRIFEGRVPQVYNMRYCKRCAPVYQKCVEYIGDYDKPPVTHHYIQVPKHWKEVNEDGTDLHTGSRCSGKG